jgi:hypothetical protein
LSLKLGIISNKNTNKVRDDVKERPADETVTAYSFIKQPFFHKAYAINDYEKRKLLRKKRRCFA